MSPPAATACVTGATGYVASELIKQLLARGYAVKATVRCAADAPRLQYLRDLAASSEGSLQLVQVPDIESPSEALGSAIEGCSYLFHVASPFRFDGGCCCAAVAVGGSHAQGQPAAAGASHKQLF